MHLIVADLLYRLAPLRFAEPVTHVYNPLDYARQGYDRYCEKFGGAPKEVLFVGMNPGPWGMVQTGVPFGDVTMVRDWLDIRASIKSPENPHPRRPIDGFACPRGEISGQRLWGWAKDRFGRPERFFERFWVANYCPLAFMERTGRNRTPDKLKKIEKIPLFEACDEALRRTAVMMEPRHVVGIGNFAYRRALAALAKMPIAIGRISHPSPANPKANKGWSRLIEKELLQQGIKL
jgi:single-strand selective monofunctional uracil DNA glycosylase